jgi:hypothetical protein
MNKQQINRNYMIVILLIHVVYFLFALYFKQIYTLDSEEYILTAKNLLSYSTVYNGIWSKDPIPELYTLRPPLYGAFIFISRFFSTSDFLVLFFQNLLSVILWILFISWFNRSFTRKNIEPFVVMALIFFPSQMIEVNSIMADLLLEFLLFLAFLFLIRYHQSKKGFDIFSFNLFLALALFTKPIMLYFWIPNLVYSIYLYMKSRNYVIILSFLLLPFMAFIWSLRNMNKTEVFMYSSAKSQNLLDFNAGSVLKFLHGDKESKEIIGKILNLSQVKKSYPEKTEFLLNTASQIISDNLGEYSKCDLIAGNYQFVVGKWGYITNCNPSISLNYYISII